MKGVWLGLSLGAALWGGAAWVWGASGIAFICAATIVLGGLLWVLDRPFRETDRVGAVRIEPRLSLPQRDRVATPVETQEFDVSCDARQRETSAWPAARRLQDCVASWPDDPLTEGYFIPAAASQGALDTVRDAFSAPGANLIGGLPDPDLVAFDAKVAALHANIAAANEARVTAEAIKASHDAALALARRVTPELMGLPIPSAAREILEELAALGGLQNAGEGGR